MSAPVSLLMSKIKRLEQALAQCREPTSSTALAQPNLNTSTVTVQIPADAAEALRNLKSEIARSSCSGNKSITDKLSFLSAKMAGGKRSKRTMRKCNKRKGTIKRKH